MTGRAERPEISFSSGGEHHHPFHHEAHRYMATSEGAHLVSHTTSDTSSHLSPVEIIAPVPGETKMRRFDQKKAPPDLARDPHNGFLDRTSPESNRVYEARPSTDTTVPKISVGMQDLQNLDTMNPHFVIKQDGTIEMHGNPETLNAKDINIVLERQDGQLNPTTNQKRATDELVRYLSDRIRSRYPDATQMGVELNDKDNAVSDATKRVNKLRPSAEQQNMTPETRDAVEQAHRLNGTNGIDMPHQSTEHMGSFNSRSVPRQLNETDRIAATKEAIAGLFKPGATDPYDTVRNHPDGHMRVGRYGFSGKQISSWLAGLDLGDPPDPAKIEELIKEGKLPKGFNAASLAKLKGMAAKMEHGEPPSKEEMKTFLPKELQEQMAMSMVNQFKQQMGGQENPGAITAAFMSGKAPGEVTQADLSTPEARQLMDAGQKLYDVATARQQTTSDGVVGQIPQGERKAVIEQALSEINKYADQNGGRRVEASPQNLAAINLMIQKESSWKADIVNNWDSNARKGTPSKGLMQTIGPTFEANKLPGHDNILDPVDNIIAGVRYATKRYGSLENVPGVKAAARGLAYRGY